MFPTNPVSQLASSTDGFSPPNSFFYHEKADVHYSYHQKNDGPFISADFLFHAYLSSTPHPVTENVATIKQDSFRQPQLSEGSGFQHSEDQLELLDSVISRYTKKIATTKKDERSKIYTARGPRDRRVRLSIDISRKFFCLQDLLGFDKASKTLDWLFSKSKIAIQELVDDTTHNPSSKVTDESKLKFLDTINKGSVEDNAQKRTCFVGKKKKATIKAGFQENLGREQSRTEARARARERTREKLRVKKLDDDLKTLDRDSFESGF